MEPLYIVFVVLIGIGAGFIQRTSGFGLSIFAMLFLPLFMPSQTAAASIATLLSAAPTTYNAIRYRKNVSFKTVLPMMAAAAVTIPVAAYFSSKVSGDLFKILLGSVMILLSLYFLFLGKRIKIRPTAVNGVISGSISGVLHGLFSTGGPPAVLYLTNATSENITYFATIQLYFCLTNIYAIATRIILNQIDLQVLLYSLIGIVGCFIGDFIGKLVFNKLNAQTLKTIIYIGMIISGIVMFF